MELRLGDKDGALHRSCHDDKDSEETEAEGMESAVGICRFVKKHRQKLCKMVREY